MKRKIDAILAACAIFTVISCTAAVADSWVQEPAGWGRLSSSSYYHSWAADDFRFNERTSVDSVEWWSTGNISDMPVAEGFYVRFFANEYDTAAGKYIAGSQLYEAFISSGINQTQDGDYVNYSVDISSSPFLAEEDQTYWISIQHVPAAGNADPWWGISHSDTLNLSVAEYNSWYYDHYSIDGWHNSFHDLAIGLHGSAAPVPEPATMLLFGTGLLGFAGSRLRKGGK